MKKFVIAALLLLMVGSTTLAFAWWDSLQTEENDITIGIGEGVTISVSLEEHITGNLVPAGVVQKTGDVTEVVIDFEVSLSPSELVSALNLSAVASNIAIGGDTDLAQYVSVVRSGATTIQNDVVTVTFTVTLLMDENTPSAAVSRAQKSDITFDVTFEATQQ